MLSSVRFDSLIIRSFALLAVAAITSCTRYTPQPIVDDAPPLASSMQGGIAMAANQPGLQHSYSVNLEDGLNLTEIGILAVLNNPRLQAQRASASVGQAQVFASGLVPDPRFSGSVDRPDNDAPDLVDGWLSMLEYDFGNLITRNARIEAAQASQEKLNLDILWKEWQVDLKARSLAVRLQFEQQQLALLHNIKALYKERYEHSARALERHDTTLSVSGTDLSALADVISQLSQVEQTHNKTRYDLNLLLGLQGEVKVPLSAMSAPPMLDRTVAESYIQRMPASRPDLLSLKAGYASQESRVRAAVLAQYPAVTVGFNRARDTSNIHSSGVSVSLQLPFFSGNRGNIAIERATRRQLREEYHARLAEAEKNARQLLSLQQILHDKQAQLEKILPTLQSQVNNARAAYAHGDINALTFLNLESTWVNKKLESLDLKRSLWENRIALEALLAMPEYSATNVIDPSEPVK
ncbi:TolC family protein [Microbulbifer sp. SAOS-129_SWC]|uniref:TolC family protein n=1 Tax=Microbulbifer sp. SAOS-129_SWC TaxID=3145235 RepID=UPI0032169512